MSEDKAESVCENDLVERTTKRTQRRLTVQAAEELTAAYKAGEPVKELAARFKISRSAVTRRMARQGVRRRYPLLTSEDVDEAVQLYETGKPLVEIGAQFAVDARTVNLALRKRGVRDRSN